MNFLSVDNYIDAVARNIPNERLGRAGFNILKTQSTTSLTIYSPYHVTLTGKLTSRHMSFAQYLYGHEEILGSLDKEKPVDILKLESGVPQPKFFDSLDTWKKYLHSLQNEKQLRQVEDRIEELIIQIRKRRQQL